MISASCICLTYRRPELLEESVESFLRQTYKGKKELIILNDEPEQTLEIDHPEIKIYNYKERFSSIGEKRDEAINLSNNEYLFPWDDDDIMLPNRIEYSLDKIESLGVDRYKLSACYSLSNRGSHIIPHINFHGGLYGCSVFSRKLFKAAGGHPKINTGEDSGFEQRCHSLPEFKIANDCSLKEIDDVYYIYRWGGEQYHVSAYGNEEVLGLINRLTNDFKKGKITINPKWKHDYVFMCEEAKKAHIKKITES